MILLLMQHGDLVIHALCPNKLRQISIIMSVGNVDLFFTIDTAWSMQEEKSNEEGAKWHRSERSRMWARRSVRLPETARLDGIKAKYLDGVLTVAVPKDEKRLQSRAINIE